MPIMMVALICLIVLVAMIWLFKDKLLTDSGSASNQYPFVKKGRFFTTGEWLDRMEI